MKKLVFLFAASIATAAFAADAPAPKVEVDPKVDRLIHDTLPVCAGSTISYSAMEHKLPEGMKGVVVKIDGRPSCAGQLVAITSRQGGFYLGLPWFLDNVRDQPTLEAKLSTFTQEAMHESFTPKVDRNPTRDGLFPVTLWETTERGKVPLYGAIDPAGTIFFFGQFRPVTEDQRTARMKAFEPFIADSPATGAAKPAVTVIEFSDFECPSCQHASSYMKPLLEKYGDKVRYVRYDLPLVTMHPWAFTAAIAGRAIWHQKPELFWDFKKQVYDNQEKLNAFTIDDFMRNYAKDHDLNMEKFDAEVANESLKAKLMEGVGTAFSNDIRATPTYIVNGVMVDAGDNGAALHSYVESQLKK
jgi:protein-disulfide isomerase